MDLGLGLRGHGSYFEKVVERYGNPALQSDLKALSNKDDILDPLVMNMRDALLQFHQGRARDVSEDPKASWTDPPGNRNCPIYKALCRLPLNREVLTEPLLQDLRAWMYAWGKPIHGKHQQLRDMELRVQSHKTYLQKMRKDGQKIFNQTSRNVTKDIYQNRASKRIDWTNLKRVSIRQLKLFTPMNGSFLEGKLICDPFTPMVGCTSLLEDDRGDVILIALYNFLPEGAVDEAADSIANTKIPNGSRIRIAEPFLKIFRNGDRGLRIDNPHELDITLPKRSGASPDLAKQKSEGNALFAKSWYHAASETYLAGLRNDDMTATLLSNRAQTNIFIGDHAAALADAAASLTLRPENKKTWTRYETARKALIPIQKSEQLREVIRQAFLYKPTQEMDDNLNANKTKELGNEAFKRKDFETARSIYSKALSACGASRAMLSNWSLCALHMNAMHDALAASFASLRIGLDVKAAYRLAKSLLLLGQPDLAIEVCDALSACFQDNKKGLESLQELKTTAITLNGILEHNDFQKPLCAFSFPKEMTPNWHYQIETFDAGVKGRGVRATADIECGEPVLIERPIAACEVRWDNHTMTTGVTKIDDGSQSAIKSAIVNRAERDGLLSRIVDNLADGKSPKAVVPFSSLMLNLELGPLLLPGHHEYLDHDEMRQVQLSADQVDGIVKINAHGFKHDEKGSENVKSEKDKFISRQLEPGTSTELFPGLSMFNHASSPNCRWLGASDRCVVVAVRPVAKGEELTVSYHPDEETVGKNWGF